MSLSSTLETLWIPTASHHRSCSPSSPSHYLVFLRPLQQPSDWYPRFYPGILPSQAAYSQYNSQNDSFYNKSHITPCNYLTSSSLALPEAPITQSSPSWLQSYFYHMIATSHSSIYFKSTSQHTPMAHGSLHHLSRSMLKCVLIRVAFPSALMDTACPVPQHSLLLLSLSSWHLLLCDICRLLPEDRNLVYGSLLKVLTLNTIRHIKGVQQMFAERLPLNFEMI